MLHLKVVLIMSTDIRVHYKTCLCKCCRQTRVTEDPADSVLVLSASNQRDEERTAAGLLPAWHGGDTAVE